MFFPFPVRSDAMVAEQRLLSVPELSHHLAESYLTCCLYLQEMLQYKRQNHGKVTNRKCTTSQKLGHTYSHFFRAQSILAQPTVS